MAVRRSDPQLSQLWQLPLLLLSFALFGYAAWLLIDPQPGPTVEEQIAMGRQLIKADRPHAAVEHLNQLLSNRALEPEQVGKVHLLLAEAVWLGQSKLKFSIAANHLQVIEQTRLAMGREVELDAGVFRRLGESQEALGRTREALESYRRAMALSPENVPALRRKVIGMLIDAADPTGADAELVKYLEDETLATSERAWALGERAQILSDAGKFADARMLLDEAMRLVDPQSAEADRSAIGQVHYRRGYAAWRLGDETTAEREMRAARDLMGVGHPLDADAAWVLGEIMQRQGKPQIAITFFDHVLTSHPDARVAVLARLGRGISRLQSNETDPAMVDLYEATQEIGRRPARMKHRDAVVDALQQGQRILEARDEYAASLELLAYEKDLTPAPAPEFFGRMASLFERRADQLDRSAVDAVPAEKLRRQQQARETRIRAGNAFLAYSQQLVLIDDVGYGRAMWKGIELFDRAGDLQGVISALELFIAERPDDPLTPEALLRLGRAFQAAGMFDKAIAAFQRNQFRYPNTLAASKSGVPLAQAYVAKGPEHFAKAEKVLLGVVDNNPLLTPDAEEFKQAVFELAQLYYRTERFEESIARLEEFTDRYPRDERFGQLLFLMGDSYRKSAGLIDAQLASATSNATASIGETPAIDPAEASKARADRLRRARELYDKSIAYYRNADPGHPTDQLYFRLAHFYRADCMYDLGEYEQAIALYDTAAFKYQDDPSALAAYVQIVNAYCALGRTEEAKTANERAKWLLRRIPPEAFNDGTFTMPKQYWEQWLQWSSKIGMW